MSVKLVGIAADEDSDISNVIKELESPLKNHKSGFYYKYNDYKIKPINQDSPDAEAQAADCIVAVINPAQLEKGFAFAFKIILKNNGVIIFLNFNSSSKIPPENIDEDAISAALGVPVIKSTPNSASGINRLLEQIHIVSNSGRFTQILTGESRVRPAIAGKKAVFIKPRSTNKKNHIRLKSYIAPALISVLILVLILIILLNNKNSPFAMLNVTSSVFPSPFLVLQEYAFQVLKYTTVIFPF